MENTLRNRYGFLKTKTFYNILTGLLVLGIIIYYFCSRVDIVKTNEVKLVDKDGQVLLRIAAPLPNPLVQGKKYERSRVVDGVQFLDKNGNEVGGLAVNAEEGVGGLCFNYEAGEAACFYKDKEDVALDFYAKKEGTEAGSGTKRFALGFSGKNDSSFLVLSDKNGKERIKFSVDDAHAKIQMFDANGQETYTIAN
ncbi:MAG: hypothetical protein HY559_02515 [Gammaproteobacteria bacterium]|nr:hypothetical protein [Gammaproteobacteria bacterium]